MSRSPTYFSVRRRHENSVDPFGTPLDESGERHYTTDGTIYRPFMPWRPSDATRENGLIVLPHSHGNIVAASPGTRTFK